MKESERERERESACVLEGVREINNKKLIVVNHKKREIISKQEKAMPLKYATTTATIGTRSKRIAIINV